MFRTDADFVFTVSRDFVRSCQTPVLIMPDDVPSHPYVVAMESSDARDKRRSQHVTVEGAEGANPAGRAPGALFPARPPAWSDLKTARGK